MKRVAFFVVLSLVGLCLPSAFADKQVPDDLIYDNVRRKLSADAEVKGGALEVEVHSGVVTLKGKVKTEKQKAKAEKLTRKVKGVTKVVNNLVVEPY
jgi:osmotically-inducible protein OsmY